MRLRFLLSAFVLVSGAACGRSLARLAGPTGALQGSWQTWPLVPSGSGVNMSLATTGSNVVGTGRASALQYDLGPLTVTGQEEIDGAFRLTVRYDVKLTRFDGHRPEPPFWRQEVSDGHEAAAV
jgi:hypothetical protein